MLVRVSRKSTSQHKVIPSTVEGKHQDITGLMISLSEFDAFVILFCFYAHAVATRMY